MSPLEESNTPKERLQLEYPQHHHKSPFLFFFHPPFRFSTNILLSSGPKLGHTTFTLTPHGPKEQRKKKHISGQTHSTRRFAVITRTFSLIINGLYRNLEAFNDGLLGVTCKPRLLGCYAGNLKKAFIHGFHQNGRPPPHLGFPLWVISTDPPSHQHRRWWLHLHRLRGR